MFKDLGPLRRQLRQTLVRSIPVFVLLATWAVHTTPTTGEPEPPGLLESLYSVFQLFALGASGFPLDPWSINGLVYVFAMFAAPIVLGGTALDFASEILRTVGTIQREVDGMADHVIVCGLGTHGKGFAAVACEAGREVVGIKLGDGEGTRLRIGGSSMDNHIPILHGDIRDEQVLLRAGIMRAHSVVFATGSPLINLKTMVTAWKLLGPPHSHRTKMIFLHDGTAKNILSLLMGGDERIQPFDRNNMAMEVVKQISLEATEKAQRVAVVGVGRLGRAICNEMLTSGLEPRSLVLVDPCPNPKKTAQLVERARNAGWTVSVEKADGSTWAAGGLDIPNTWQVFITIDDDIAALEAAGELRKTLGDFGPDGMHVVLRVVDAELAAELSEHAKSRQALEVLGVEDLMRSTIKQNTKGVLDHLVGPEMSQQLRLAERR